MDCDFCYSHDFATALLKTAQHLLHKVSSLFLKFPPFLHEKQRTDFSVFPIYPEIPFACFFSEMYV